MISEDKCSSCGGYYKKDYCAICEEKEVIIDGCGCDKGEQGKEHCCYSCKRHTCSKCLYSCADCKRYACKECWNSKFGRCTPCVNVLEALKTRQQQSQQVIIQGQNPQEQVPNPNTLSGLKPPNFERWYTTFYEKVFCFRKVELGKINDILKNENLAYIAGSPSIGKTALAAAFFAKLPSTVKRYVVDLSDSKCPNIQTAFYTVFGVHPENLFEHTKEETIYILIRSLEGNKNTGIDEECSKALDYLFSLFKNSSNCKLVVTSRYEGLKEANRVSVGKLSTQEIRVIFSELLKKKNLEKTLYQDQNRDYEELINLIDGHPGVLVNIVNLLDVFEIKDIVGKIKSLNKDYYDHVDSLLMKITLTMLYESLKNHKAEQLFQFMSLFPGGVDFEKVFAGNGPLSHHKIFASAYGELIKLNLICKVDTDNKALLYLLRPFRSFARMKMPKDQLISCLIRLADFYDQKTDVYKKRILEANTNKDLTCYSSQNMNIRLIEIQDLLIKYYKLQKRFNNTAILLKSNLELTLRDGDLASATSYLKDLEELSSKEILSENEHKKLKQDFNALKQHKEKEKNRNNIS